MNSNPKLNNTNKRMLINQEKQSNTLDNVDFQRGFIRRFRNSEHDEQELVRSFFANARRGFFVEIGANDPFDQSQSYHLEQIGWDGLLVEPLPEMADRLRQNRKATVVQCAASSNANSGKELLLKRAGVHSTLNTTFAARKVTADEKKQQSVHCRTLDDILTECSVPKEFEFLSIDVEGHEPQVLDGFTIERWKPQLVLIEDHLTHLRTHRRLTESSYALVLRTGHNSWYVPRARRITLSLSARCGLVRKLYASLPFRKWRALRG